LGQRKERRKEVHDWGPVGPGRWSRRGRLRWKKKKKKWGPVGPAGSTRKKEEEKKYLDRLKGGEERKFRVTEISIFFIIKISSSE